VPLVETALLVDKPSAADSIARTISLTTDLQFPDDDDDSLSADRRALVMYVSDPLTRTSSSRMTR
jgi:hypothetical protein